MSRLNAALGSLSPGFSALAWSAAAAATYAYYQFSRTPAVMTPAEIAAFNTARKAETAPVAAAAPPPASPAPRA